MIDKESNPIEWAMFMYELEDASEHLTTLIDKLSTSPNFSEDELKIHIAHIYSHLNRAWHFRNTTAQPTELQTYTAGKFPTDIEPI